MIITVSLVNILHLIWTQNEGNIKIEQNVTLLANASFTGVTFDTSKGNIEFENNVYLKEENANLKAENDKTMNYEISLLNESNEKITSVEEEKLVVDINKFDINKIEGYIPGENTTEVPFSELSWNSLKSTGSHSELNWGSGTKLLDGATFGDKVFYSDGYLTLTFRYSEITDFVAENGDAVFMLRISVTTDIYIASMENTQFASPKVKYVYYQ